MPERILIIANPVAGRSSKTKIEKATSILKAIGFNVEIFFTKGSGDGISIAKDIVKSSYKDLLGVIAAGGDGTFNEVANGLIGSNIPMALLPLGTTNVLAKELGIPEDIEKAVGVIRGKPVSVRPAKITLLGDDGNNYRVSRYFLLMAGIGFDGDAVYGVNKKLKKLSGKLAYILSGAKIFIGYSPQPLNLFIDGQEFDGYNAVICKASCYGGYFKMAPDADLRDSSLYAVVFTKKTRRSLIKYVSGVLFQRHIRFKDVIYRKASRVIVHSNRHVQIDGDYFGKGPVEISSGNLELKIFLP